MKVLCSVLRELPLPYPGESGLKLVSACRLWLSLGGDPYRWRNFERTCPTRVRRQALKRVLCRKLRGCQKVL